METGFEPWSTSSFNGAVSPHLSAVIFKKKWDTIQSNGDGRLRHFETVKWLILFIHQKAAVKAMQNSEHAHCKLLKLLYSVVSFQFSRNLVSRRRGLSIPCCGSLQREEGSSQLWDSRWLWVAFLCWVRSPGFTNSANSLTRCKSPSVSLKFFCNFPLSLASLGNFHLRSYIFFVLPSS